MPSKSISQLIVSVNESFCFCDVVRQKSMSACSYVIYKSMQCRFTQSDKKINGWYKRAPHIKAILGNLPSNKVADVAGLRECVNTLCQT